MPLASRLLSQGYERKLQGKYDRLHLNRLHAQSTPCAATRSLKLTRLRCPSVCDSLMVRTLTDIVKEEDITESEWMTTVLVVVPK